MVGLGKKKQKTEKIPFLADLWGASHTYVARGQGALTESQDPGQGRSELSHMAFHPGSSLSQRERGVQAGLGVCLCPVEGKGGDQPKVSGFFS